MSDLMQFIILLLFFSPVFILGMYWVCLEIIIMIKHSKLKLKDLKERL